MQGYIANFIVYTMAMVGFICLALFVYKKSMNFPQNLANKDYLKVENLIKLAPTKTVYIIKVGCERFLVAGDASSTTMLAKLDKDNLPPVEEISTMQNQELKIPNLQEIMNKFNNRG